MRSVAARRVLVFALALLLAATGSIGGATAPRAADAPDTTIRITLEPDGDARVVVTARFAIDSPNETRAFDRLAEEFGTGETAVLSVEPFRRAARLAGEATGRPMAIEDVSRSAMRGNDTGRLTLSFTWTAFARVNGDRMRLGDVFTTPSGTWLPELTAEQELIIEFPEEYAVRSSSRRLDNGTFHIRGPEEFDPGEPWATLERQDQSPTSASPTTATRNGTDAPTTGVSLPLGVGIGVILLVALVLLVQRRRGGAGDGSPETAPGNGGSDPGGGGAGDDPSGEELLSDEERVLRLLADNDGRMKQADIVTETDWSNAKVSQLLSEMEERGEVEKLRIGRENLISLPEEAPEDAE